MRCIACSDLGVERDYSTRLDANEYLAYGDRGKLSFSEDQWPANGVRVQGHAWIARLACAVYPLIDRETLY